MKQQFKLLIALLFMMSPLAHAQSDWNFQLSPYLWFAGIEGDVATIPGLPLAPIELSPSDALHDTEASLMLLFEAKKQRHGVLLDFLYSDVQSEEDLIPEVYLAMKSTSRTTFFRRLIYMNCIIKNTGSLTYSPAYVIGTLIQS